MTKLPFKGICFGGPLDGQQIEAATPLYVMMETEPLDFTTLSEEPDDNIPLNRHEYRHVKLLFSGRSVLVEAWLHESVKSPEAAIRMMADAYISQERRNATKEPDHAQGQGSPVG